MAKYVLVEFDDDAQAKAFIRKVNGTMGVTTDPTKPYRIRAVWAKPTRFCECDRGDRGANPYRRGEKSGWWLHAACGRPHRVWAAGNHWFSALGRNLLPGNRDYVPSGYGLDRSTTDAVTEIVPTGQSAVSGGIDVKAERRKQRAAARRAARAAV